MIKNINDLVLFLQILKEFKSKTGIKKNDLFFFVKQPIGIIHWDFNSQEIYEFGISLKLFEEKNNRVILTDYGKDIIDKQDVEFDLNSEQINYLTENCFFNNSKFTGLFDFLKLFDYIEKNNSFILDSKVYPIPQKIETHLLQQLGIVTVENEQWLIDIKYNQFIEQIKEDYKINLNQQQLESILEEQKRIGNLAECLTVVYEIQRLKKNKLLNESTKVKNISKSHVNKGYDIESFSSKSINLRPNFFIEVKGRKDRRNSFIISANELHIAKKYGKNYAIYFWNNVGSSHPPTEPTKIITDPYNNLKLKECNGCLSYIVELEL